MEQQEELNKVIGTEESQTREILQPNKVKILKIGFRDTNNRKIVVFESKHPDKEEPIHITSVAYIKDKQIVISGLWYVLDSQENIQKGSALANFMEKFDAKTLKDFEGKEIDTELTEKKWLCFKAY
jgi:hypothetical protein